MAKMKLDDIRKATTAKYGSFVIETDEGDIELLNLLRVEKAKRDRLKALQDDDDTDEETMIRETFRVVALNESQADALIALLGDDLALMAEVLNQYQEATHLGEAPASAS